MNACSQTEFKSGDKAWLVRERRSIGTEIIPVDIINVGMSKYGSMASIQFDGSHGRQHRRVHTKTLRHWDWRQEEA